jgi:D-beta-D-heptose 7-phosphate kinase/D-beta-D-heptose 1-phosphate adenosyltransferase
MSERTGLGYVDTPRLLEARAAWRRAGVRVVFTNGCFDLLHRAHVEFLKAARAQGDVLVVGLNSDASMRAIKGPDRPLVAERDRAAVLAALASVDAVTIFDEPIPAGLIAALEPAVLVKGGDWPVEQMVGADTVVARGGRVLSIPLVPGYSTSSLIERTAAGRHGAGRSRRCGGAAGEARRVHPRQAAVARGVVQRPPAVGGRGFTLTGRHEVLIPLLAFAVVDALGA